MNVAGQQQHLTFCNTEHLQQGFKQTEADCYMRGSYNDRLSVVLTFCGWCPPSRMQVLSHRTLCNPEISSVNFYELRLLHHLHLTLLHLT